MKTTALLGALKRKLNSTSRLQIARSLGMTNQALTHWERNGTVTAEQAANAIAKARRAGEQEAFRSLVDNLASRLGTTSDSALARALGISGTALRNWNLRKSGLTPRSLAAALVKFQQAAARHAEDDAIRPIVEFMPLNAVGSSRGVKYELFPHKGSAVGGYHVAVKERLARAHGVYIFYDSRGRALYVGKAQGQYLWNEMKSAFNRSRETQKVYRVDHPTTRGGSRLGDRRLRIAQLQLSDLAAFVSAYEVSPGMIPRLEALLVRGFANDLLNKRMERFGGTRANQRGQKSGSDRHQRGGRR